MLKATEVLKWPYCDDLPIMDPSSSFNTSSLAIFAGFKGIHEPTPGRTLFDVTKYTETSAGLFVSSTDRARGFNAEKMLVTKLRLAGHECYELPHFTYNYIKHIDLEVQCPNGLVVHIDVESPKSLRKANHACPNNLSKPQDRFVCLQLGTHSTLYGGCADYMAFGLTNDAFLFSERCSLIEAIESKMVDFVNGTKRYRSAWPETALWIPYVRTFNEKSIVMTYMDLNDLPIISHII